MREKLGSLCGTTAVAVRSAEEKRKTPWMNYCTTLKRTVRLEVRSTIESIDRFTLMEQGEERLVVLLEICY